MGNASDYPRKALCVLGRDARQFASPIQINLYSMLEMVLLSEFDFYKIVRTMAIAKQ